MTIQTINIGTANAGDGDPIREAFDKSNDNFAELDTLKAPKANPIFTGLLTGERIFSGLGTDGSAKQDSSVSTPCAASSNIPLVGNMAGLLIVKENIYSGELALFLLNIGGTAILVSQTGARWSATAAPAGDNHGIGYAGGIFRIYNGSGSCSFSNHFIKLG
jgi:hypothetical protein